MNPLRRLLLTACALCLLALPAALQAQDEAGDLFGRVNSLRASVGRPGYTYNAALAAAAQNQANWMLSTGSVSHTRPDGSGPRTRALNAGYPSTMVGENIYIGGMASVDTAWNFWVNSGVHYNGMVNPSFNEMGVGVAHGANGAAYVLVFGNSGGPMPPPPSSNSGSASVSGADVAAAPQGPPAYFVGVDASGNIMHQVQPGDTLGDIALIYGYSWDDLPALMALNGITDVRELEVGSIFLVPSHSGTYTPTPGGPTETPTPLPPTPTGIPPSITPYVALRPVTAATLVVTPLDLLTTSPTPAVTATPSPTATLAQAATIAQVPAEIAFAPSATATLIDVTQVSAVPTPAVSAVPASTDRGNQNTWLLIAVAVQVGVVLVAGFEFLRRRGKH